MLLYVNLHKVVSAVVWAGAVIVGAVYLAMNKKKSPKSARCGAKCAWANKR